VKDLICFYIKTQSTSFKTLFIESVQVFAVLVYIGIGVGDLIIKSGLGCHLPI